VEELRDTPLEVENRRHDLYRRMSHGQKLGLLFAIQILEDAFALERIRLRYPHASERELVLRRAASRYPRELMIRAFGWDPESAEPLNLPE
jgi:hypothetical protein